MPMILGHQHLFNIAKVLVKVKVQPPIGAPMLD